MIVLPGADRENWPRLNKLIHELLVDHWEDYRDRDRTPLLQMRFPKWVVLQHPDRCERAYQELMLMAEDRFEHETGAIHDYALYQTLRGWVDILGDAIGGESDPKEAERLSGMLEDVDFLLEAAFHDTDFEMLPQLVEDLRRRGPLRAEMGVDLEDFLDLLPDDIRDEVERRLAEEPNDRESTSPGPSPPEPTPASG